MKVVNILRLGVFYAMLYSFSSVSAGEYRIGDLTINDKKSNKSTTFSKQEIEKLPRSSITTSTPWLSKTTFSGVSIKDVLKAAGYSGNHLRVHALNDYWVDIPMSDVNKYNIILANKRGDVALRVRDFGPYFVVYPIDDYPSELAKPIFYSRSIWQVDSITVMK
ncbi:oxidoreductase [Serratia marcescens]|uniref:oxidoreductase n=1 Tax=Serratia marcescens TaxID=615 RepID=UPI0032049845